MPVSTKTLGSKIECPYCGTFVRLGDCPIVATSSPEGMMQLPILLSGEESGNGWQSSDAQGPEDDDAMPMPGHIEPALSIRLASQGSFEPVSRSPVLGWTRAGWPVIAHPRLSEAVAPNSRRRLGRRLRSLPNISREAPIEDLPARACTSCGHPLPSDAGLRPLKILAVVGTIGAGKTHFLAEGLHEAFHNQSLKPYGYKEFFPDEATAFRYDSDLYEKVLITQKAADPTATANFHHYLPFAFRVARNQRDYATVLIHDIPGDALMNRDLKAQYLSFLRRAHGIVFLIDPKYLPAFRGRVKPDRDAQGTFTQSNIVLSCLSELELRRGVTSAKPRISIAISKSDVLPNLMDRSFSFTADGPSPDDTAPWNEDRIRVTSEVMELLRDTGAHDLLGITENFAGEALFHAVAPIGAERTVDRGIELRPRRCTEVLAGALDGIFGVRKLDWLGRAN